MYCHCMEIHEHMYMYEPESRNGTFAIPTALLLSTFCAQYLFVVGLLIRIVHLFM